MRATVYTSLKITYAPGLMTNTPTILCFSCYYHGWHVFVYKSKHKAEHYWITQLPREHRGVPWWYTTPWLIYQNPHLSHRRRTLMSLKWGRERSRNTSFIILKTNSIHYAYGLGGSVSIGLDKKRRRRKPKDTTAMLRSQGWSAAFIQSLWSIYGQSMLVHYEHVSVRTNAI